MHKVIETRGRAMKQDLAPAVTVVSLSPDRVGRAKVGFSCRRVPVAQMATLIAGEIKPHSGDVVLARVEKLGQHKNLETRVC